MEMKNEKLVRFYANSVKEQRSSMPCQEKSSTGYKFSPPLFNSRAISKVFDTLKFDHKPSHKHILDPGSRIVLNWNRVFIVSCLLALFVDPLYFYLPSIGENDGSWCLKTDYNLRVVVTCFRSVADIFYMLHMVIKFRTAYVSPSSRVFGLGELVMDPKKIARRYIRSDFFIDLIATLPLPQFVNWFIMPAARNHRANHNNNALALIVLLQYIPRLYVMFPLSSQIIKATGVVTKTAWAGAAYNLLLYMLASHVLGAAWYVLSVDRSVSCWKSVCRKENSTTKCLIKYLNCDSDDSRERSSWILGTDVFRSCDPGEDISFDFGIFQDLVTKRVASSSFSRKYFYCLWWGLQNLSSYGQNLSTSTFIGETSFSILIAILGLVLFAHLIGNMESMIGKIYLYCLGVYVQLARKPVSFLKPFQFSPLERVTRRVILQTYLQSLTIRLEEWRLKQRDTEGWMRHRQLPEDLRRRVRRFDQYKWLATRGVHGEAILQGLPADLSRDIQRHLCLDLVKRVPFFAQMDDQLLDAICQRLVSSLSTKETYIVREGDPVTDMLFIIRGQLESSTTNGGQTGFFNSITLKPGDFCGEELLAWALVPKSSAHLPASTRTVRALVEVEAFALSAQDLKFVANQFRRLHSKKLQHTFRFYSHHWRTWAACFIQAAWRRYNRRKIGQNLSRIESFASDLMTEAHTEGRDHESLSNVKSELRWKILASRLAETTRRGVQRIEDVNLPKLPKPEEPDFSDEPDD